MTIARRNTDKDAVWIRAWDVSTIAELASIPEPRRGDQALCAEDGNWYTWTDDDTWRVNPLSSDPSFDTVQLLEGQLGFPATQNPSSDVNTLDDYEEGNWTPALQGSATAGAFTYTIQTGRYEKIGRLVIARFRVAGSSIDTTPTGFLQLAGLPFSGSSSEAPAGFLTFYKGATAPAGATVLSVQLGVNGTVTTFIYSGPGITGGGLNASNLSAPFEFRGSIGYNV